MRLQMMKTILIGFALTAMGLAPLTIHAEVTDEEIKSIKNYVLDRYTIEPKLLTTGDLSKVTTKKIFEVKVIQTTIAGAIKTETLRLMKDDGGLVQLIRPGSTKKCEELVRLFNREITINNAEEARVVERALDTVFPIGTFDKKHKKLYREGKKWIFIRGDIFMNLQGFVFTIDDQGHITSIDYSTGFTPKQ